MSAEMIHIVVFKFDPEKFAAEFPGNELQEGLSHLRNTIPGVVSLDMNEKNTAPWGGYEDCARGYTHCLVSRHKDAEALHVYADHPDHKAFQGRMGKCMLAPPLRMELNVAAKL